MIKIGVLDLDRQEAIEALLRGFVTDFPIEIYHDICQPLDIFIVNKIPEGYSVYPENISAKTIIANSDDKHVLRFVTSLNGQIITYGLNSKAAITASSHFDDIYVICVQRAMASIHDVPILPREFSVKINDYRGFDGEVMGAISAALICGACFE